MRRRWQRINKNSRLTRNRIEASKEKKAATKSKKILKRGDDCEFKRKRRSITEEEEDHVYKPREEEEAMQIKTRSTLLDQLSHIDRK